jgi:hypothetical protein
MFGLFGSGSQDIYGDTAGLSGGGGRGLGGMSNTLMMAGLGLMSSPRTNPWENVMKGVVAGSALDERSSDKNEQAAAVYQALRASGVPHQQALLAAKSPAAAQILLDVRKQQISKEATTDAFSRAEKFLGMPGDDSGAPRVSPAAPQPPVPSMKGGGRRSDAPAEFAPLFAEKEKEYNLPEGYLARTASLESSFNPNAKNPKSSASGLFQFINSTARQYGLADPFDPVASTDAAARLAATNAAGLKRALGRDPTAGELYLAHQQGLGGATKILSNPNASVASLVGGEAARLNAGGGKTGGQFAQQWLNKFGAASPARSTQVASNDSGFMPGPLSEEEVGLEPVADAAPAPSPQSSLDPETQKIKDQYDAQIKELLGTGQIKKAEQLEAMRDTSMAQRMQSMPPQQVASADNSVPGASPALRPSYTGTPPGYDWKTATDPGPAAPPPAQQQTANVPLPPERPPETYTPRAPLRPVASQPPIASIDPNSSNAGAIQFAASGMGRGGMPASPQTSMAAAQPPAPVAAQPSQSAGVQVAQAPTQTATDAVPAAQAQAQVAAQQGQRIIESTPQKAPEQYPAGSSSQRVSAQDFYRRGVGLGMIAATPNLPENVSKFFAEKSKWYLERAGKFIDPTDAEKVVDRLGLPREQANELLRQTLPNQGLTELQKNARAVSGDPLKQQELIERGMPDKTPEVLRLNRGIRDDAERKQVTDLKRAGAGQPEFGTIPAGYRLKRNDDGSVQMEPIPGSPAAIEAKEKAEKEARLDQSKTATSDVVTKDIDRILEWTKTATLPTTGTVGSFVKNIPGTAAHDVSKTILGIEGNIAFSKLQNMRDASPTGGALGQVAVQELDMLKATLGSVAQSQSKETFEFNLRRLRNDILDVIHGPGKGPERVPLAASKAQATGNAPPPSFKGDSNLWKYMTPEERALWK